jgi:hypothetical protein
MPDYSLSKIYAIKSHLRPDLIYVGSTVQPLSRRMAGHRSTNSTSKQIINLGDAYIELLEAFPCNNIEQLLSRENHYIRSMNCINKNIAIADCTHGRNQNTCLQCVGSAVCEHNKRRAHCVDCKGCELCPHSIRKLYCCICSPAYCEFCNTTTSTGGFKRHTNTQKHLNAYRAEFMEVFEMNITNAEIPRF